MNIPQASVDCEAENCVNSSRLDHQRRECTSIAYVSWVCEANADIFHQWHCTNPQLNASPTSIHPGAVQKIASPSSCSIDLISCKLSTACHIEACTGPLVAKCGVDIAIQSVEA